MSRYSSGFLTLLAATVVAMPALAVNPETPSWARLHNVPVVVVTPTKSAWDVENLPFAVSVVTRNEKLEKQAQSFDDLLNNIPNFSSAGGNRNISEEPSLRGLSDRRMVIKIDGIRRNFRAEYAGRYFIDPMLVDRIEVVRGSNSALDGSGAIAGTMQFFTTNVLNELRGSKKSYGFQAGTGFQTNQKELSTMFQGYGKQGPVDFYMGGSYRDANDYRDGNGNRISPSGAQPVDAIVKAGYSFSPSHRAEFRVSRFFDTSSIPASPFQPLDPVTNPATERQSGVTDYGLSYHFSPQDSQFNKWIELTSIIYRSEYDISTRRLSDNRLDQTYFSTNGIDTYNTAKLGDFGKLTTGVEYFQDGQKGYRNGAIRTLLGTGEDSNIGFYLEHEITLWDRLTIIPGVRFDHYQLRPGDPALVSRDRNHWSPKIGANYRVNDEFSFYGSVAESFRTPTLTELYATGSLGGPLTLVPSPNLEPEIAVNKEIGMRYKKASAIATNDAISLKLSVFQNDIKDFIEQTLTGFTAQYRNDAQARLRGIELEGSYRISNYNFILSAGAVRGENETLGTDLAGIPGDRVSLAAERYMLENQFKGGVRTTFHAEQNKVPSGSPLITPSAGAVTYDVYTSYTPDPNENGSFRIDFTIDNITDKGYRQQLAFIPEMGRNAKIALNWKF
jgi:hemoglobin/transferrin/lactoferrin receptor protein